MLQRDVRRELRRGLLLAALQVAAGPQTDAAQCQEAQTWRAPPATQAPSLWRPLWPTMSSRDGRTSGTSPLRGLAFRRET